MKKWLSLVLAMAMCLMATMGGIPSAFAENDEVFADAVDSNVGEAGEADFAGLDGDDLFDDSTEGAETDAFTADEYTSVETEETSCEVISMAAADSALSTDTPSADDTDGSADDDTDGSADDDDPAADDSADNTDNTEESFVPWYARANTSLTLDVDESVSLNVPAGSILLVIEEAGEGLLRVACEKLSSVVDSTALDALTEDEIATFMDEVSLLETVILYNDMPDYPLPPEPMVQDNNDTSNKDENTSDDGQEGTDDPENTKDNDENQKTDDPDDAGEEDENASGKSDGDGENVDQDESENKDNDGEEEDSKEKKDSEDSEEKKDSEGSEDGEDSGEKKDSEGEDDKEKKEDGKEEDKKEENDEEKSTTDSAEAANQSAEQGDGTATDETATAENVTTVAEGSGVPTSIVFNRSALTLGLKESYTGLTATVVDAIGAPVDGQAVSWRSSNPRVIKVDASGKLTAVRRGKSTIIASVTGLPEAAIDVLVRKAPSKVKLTPKRSNMSIGMGVQLTAKLDKGAGCGMLTYTSSNPGVAVVDENGVVTGVGLGSATIHVRTFNKKRASCKVYVYSAPASISTDKPSYALLHGAKEKLTFNILDGAGGKTYAGLNIVSSDPNCVAVDANGNMTGLNIGTSTLTITTHNGLTTSCTVDVCGAAADMVMSASTITIGVREKYDRLTYTLVPPAGQEKCAATVKWRSANKKIAKVNSKTGVITGVKAGTTSIIATTNNKISRRVKVVVRKAPKSVSLSPKEMSLTAGMAQALSASYNSKYQSDNMTYTSSDPNVATVDANGIVTAVNRGTAIITAKTYNGKTDSCTVNVYDLPAQVTMTASLEVAVGMTAQLQCSTVDANGQPSWADYSFTAVSGTGSVSVDSSGVVTGQSIGTARVTVSTHNGVTTHLDASGTPVVTECVVNVVAAPEVLTRYRMFAAYSYFNVSQKGSLPFTKNNATSFQNALSSSSIDGSLRYENLGILENPSKDALLSGIKNAFSGSVDTDINVIYLCSHGYNYVDIPKSSRSTHYGLQLPGYSNYRSSSEYYITSEEIFNAISAIKGHVILVLDSCYSGQFITNMRSSLDGAGGRISVMTAATNTNACYYNISDTNTACDFFTLYLLLGAGYNMRTHQWTGSLPADSNGDGKLTFNEMFNYAKKKVKANVPKYKNKSWFHGNSKQVPNVYRGSNGDLVLFQYGG